MTGLPSVSGKRVIQVLQRTGFVLSHVRGSHHYLIRPGDSSLVTIPVHGNRDLPPGTLRSVLRQANLSVDEFVELLR